MDICELCEMPDCERPGVAQAKQARTALAEAIAEAQTKAHAIDNNWLEQPETAAAQQALMEAITWAQQALAEALASGDGPAEAVLQALTAAAVAAQQAAAAQLAMQAMQAMQEPAGPEDGG